jgi:ArsR family transcriptional regulator
MNDKINPEKLEDVATKLRALAHPSRIAIMNILETKGAMNVGELQKHLDVEQATMSHHLGILKTNRILKSFRKGRNNYYAIREDAIIRIAECLSKCKT